MEEEIKLQNGFKKHIFSRLPEELKSLTENFEGREKDIVLLSSLGVLSNCYPNIYGIYDGNEVYPHLYIIIIAPAASGKGVMNHSKILIDKIHQELLTESRQKYDECMCDNGIKNKSICPKIEIKILPANISSSAFHNHLETSKHGLIIIESEADTMGQMLNNDWSNYSDLLRKVFHHETVSISRKTDSIFAEINNPKMAMVISGTPEQLKPIIQSKENGLYSRFIIYSFNERTNFRDVFAKKNRKKKKTFEDFSVDIFETHKKLKNIDDKIEFTLTKKQENKFIKTFDVFPNQNITEPEIRISHQIRGRIPTAIHKSVKDLEDHEKTTYYERMAFIMRIPSISDTINGNKLSLTIGGVRAYNTENLYSKKSIEKFKFFVGFQNMVCCNLCVSSDGVVEEMRVGSLSELQEKVISVLQSYQTDTHLQQMKDLTNYELTEHQFAQLIGRLRLSHYLPKSEKELIPNFSLNDGQISTIAKDYYQDERFCKNDNGNINLWNVYNLFTNANKSSYIDTFLNRNLNVFDFTQGITKALNGEENYSWYLN